MRVNRLAYYNSCKLFTHSTLLNLPTKATAMRLPGWVGAIPEPVMAELQQDVEVGGDSQNLSDISARDSPFSRWSRVVARKNSVYQGELR